MNKIELKEGTSVVTADGKEVGEINRFVLDPDTNEVTHVVVQKGWLLSEDKVVPFDRVRSATEDKVVLNEDIEDFNDLPSFEESHFVRAPEDTDSMRTGGYSYIPGYYWYPPPYGYVGYPAYGLGYSAWPPVETTRNIPEDTIALKEGSNVISSDGEHVGDVERLFLEPTSNQVTHFVISQGLLFKDHKLVPANWIRTVKDNEVHLTVSSDALERLPTYEA